MIKKIFILASLLLCCQMASHAQNKFRQELSVGANFGVTFSTVSFQPKVNTKMLIGYTGGLTVRWNTESNVGLQGEINLTQQGWGESFKDEPQYKYNRTINYIEMPILTHIYFGGKRVKVFFNLGPKIGYAISESTDENLNGANANITNEQHNTPIQQKFDWGLCGGPGIEFRSGIGHFLLEGRYYYALGDIFNSRKTDTFSKSSGQIIGVKLTYLLPIIK